MKRAWLLTFVALIIATQMYGRQEGRLTKEDRKYAIDYLKTNQKNLVEKVKNLTPEQWGFQPTDSTWSVAKICEHIWKAEDVVLKRVETITEREYKPDMIAASEAKTKEVLDFIVGRTEKFQAPLPVTPEGAFGSRDVFLAEFAKAREETLIYVRKVEAPIKAYFEHFGPIGEVNGYYWLLFIAAHAERHMKQIDEVLAHPDFPDETE